MSECIASWFPHEWVSCLITALVASWVSTFPRGCAMDDMVEWLLCLLPHEWGGCVVSVFLASWLLQEWGGFLLNELVAHEYVGCLITVLVASWVSWFRRVNSLLCGCPKSEVVAFWKSCLPREWVGFVVREFIASWFHRNLGGFLLNELVAPWVSWLYSELLGCTWAVVTRCLISRRTL